MTRAVAARTQGDDYQARFFWLKACRLFRSRTTVHQVAYEVPGLAHFDDVSVVYRVSIPDERGSPVWADHFQVKFHVDHSGEFTYEALMDPGFVGAKELSLLQRVHDFQKRIPLEPRPYRLHVVAPWGIRKDNPLSRIIGLDGGEVRLHVLFDGTSDRSKMGMVRKAWKEHLGCSNDEELKQILVPLRLRTNYLDLHGLKEFLNISLESSGLTPVPDESHFHPYDDLIKKAHQQGRNVFSRVELETLCREANLLQPRSEQDSSAQRYGIRSFLRWAEHMEDETDQMLCLVRHFDNRKIRSTPLWNQAIILEIEAFLGQMDPKAEYELQLDTHCSIALGAGYFLPPARGTKVTVVQKGIRGRESWKAETASSDSRMPLWSISQTERHSDGFDVALAVSITHDVRNDVHLYVQKALPKVARILELTIESGPDQTAIQGPAHALKLANLVAYHVKTARNPAERSSLLHLFVAAPNGFVFFLGQMARGFGRLISYEFDFDSSSPGAYQPGPSFPAR